MKRRLIHLTILYLLLWIVAFVYLLFRFSRRNGSLADYFSFFVELASRKFILIGFHIIFLLCCGLYFIVRHFIKVAKKKDTHTAWRQFSLKFVLPLLCIFIGLKTLVFVNANEWHNYTWDINHMNNSGKVKNLYELDNKHRGMSVFGWSENNTKAIKSLVKANIEWVAVIPFMFQENEKTKLINTPEFPEKYSRRDSNFIKAINDLHNNGIRVQLKPHLWMRDGWRSNITLQSEKEWDNWFESYRINMLRYAKMAQETNTELLCIGTELRTSIKQQPHKWDTLINEIRTIYNGELTYAANWYDEYEHVTFWDKLDYIGVQAYFPLTKEENPDLEIIEKGWDKHLRELKAFYEDHHKPILFTEVGYRSMANATIKPWEWDTFLGKFTKKKSNKTQQLAYEALFKKTWSEPWLAGIYIWQWHNETTIESTDTDQDFSPRFKPAENVIGKWYGTPMNRQ
ncbi:glycoside hydrolase family 113 [Maribacter sp. CXY002]|uniref:glycoside hydrolase family 113 n=1 Tax=Maribacter luteocoastalis TaxID=3407671 RepID=UPI003B6775EF